jgi:hypothetical protein
MDSLDETAPFIQNLFIEIICENALDGIVQLMTDTGLVTNLAIHRLRSEADTSDVAAVNHAGERNVVSFVD